MKWIPGVHGLETVFKWWRRFLFRIFLSKAYIIIVPSNAVKEKLKKYKISNENKIKVIPNGIGIPSKKRKSQPPINNFKIICIANFYSKIKGHKIAVEAINELPENYCLTFIGDGLEIELIKDYAYNFNLIERINFLGYLPNQDIQKILTEFDILIIPSLSEAFGISAIEAMSVGLPVVASNVGGLPELINKDLGALFPPGDPRALALEVKKICENKILWTKMHNNSIKSLNKNIHRQFCQKVIMNSIKKYN